LQIVALVMARWSRERLALMAGEIERVHFLPTAGADAPPRLQ